MMVFDRDGNFLSSYLENAHGIFIDSDDNIYCTEWSSHCVHKFNPDWNSSGLCSGSSPGAWARDPFKKRGRQ